MSIEIISSIGEIPQKYQRRHLKALYQQPDAAGGDLSLEKMSLDAVERHKTQRIIEVLGHEALKTLIRQEQITMLMVRPHAENNIMRRTDEQMTAEILSKVETTGHGLQIVLAISIPFTVEMAEEFWGDGPKQIQLTIPPIRKHPEGKQIENRWDEFVDLMTSGPTTVVLIFSPQGHAARKVRELVGHWDITRNPKTTIRGQFGLKDNYSNLVHASDSRESALREVEIIKKNLEKILRANEPRQKSS